MSLLEAWFQGTHQGFSCRGSFVTAKTFYSPESFAMASARESENEAATRALKVKICSFL
jgi:hypothetical protein